MSNLFNEDRPQIDPNKDYLSELVGEGRKYRDPQALALSKVHADQLIEDLKKQLADAQTEVQTSKRIEELLTKATEKRDPVDPNLENLSQHRNDPVNDLTAEKVTTLISESISQHERTRTASQNVESVKQALQEQFGNGYADVLTKVAQNAGVTTEWLQKTAQENPKLVLNLVQANAPKKDIPLAPPATKLNPDIAPQNDERTLGFYQKIKARDPKYYESKVVQDQMHKDALRLKDRFFDVPF